MPAVKKKVNPMIARLKKIEAVQKSQGNWQSKHEIECLKVYNQIQQATSVLPTMKAQLDTQDALLDVIREGQRTYKIGKKAVLLVVAAVAFGNGLYSLVAWAASHWH